MTIWKIITVLLASAAVAAVPALAQQVGTATAVNPTSESTPPSGTTVALTVGAHIVHKERIHTTTGTVQLLFLDKSTLSIAPNTSILIDEFVYEPNSGQGHMLAKLTQGALRYVGGELSHAGEATITTASAAIGIRGGTVTVIQKPNGSTEVINHYGTLTISNGGGTIVVTRPGFVVTITGWNTPPGQPARVTAAEITYYLNYLTSKFGQNGGVNGLKNIQYAACGTPTSPACPLPPWLPTSSGEDDAFQIIIQSTQHATGTTTPRRIYDR